MRHERIVLRSADLGEGLVVRRALPTRQRRMVGAWCFLDHIGPVHFEAGHSMRVDAHPHTGLQTFTWMIRGQVLHRDSLGSEQIIRPGQVNLMTAGAGIVHTEDSLPAHPELHAAQLWIALPPEQAAMAPAFDHYPTLPRWLQDGVQVTLLAGRYGDREAPTRIHTALLGMDLAAQEAVSTMLVLNPGFEYGLLALEGGGQINGERFDTDEFVYCGTGLDKAQLGLEAGSRILLLCGAPFGSPITMWWNFLGRDKADVIQAQADWEAGLPRFGRVQGDEGRRLAAPKLPWLTPPEQS